MDPLARRLTRLRIAGDDYLMSKGLDQNLVFMTFLINVAYRVLGKCACRNQTLFDTGDGKIRGCWHDGFPCLIDEVVPTVNRAGWECGYYKKRAGKCGNQYGLGMLWI
ncbi:hypothetical protein EMIT0357P_20110 [Pseudomonas marginalis]